MTVYQKIFTDIADIFFEYIHSLDADEVQQLDDDLKSNGWGAIDLLKTERSLELLSIFQLFYHNNGRLSQTNGLLIVPDEDAPKGEEKIILKSLDEIFRDTYSHGLFPLQFLRVLGIFFRVGIKAPKDAITELYKNPSHSTLSGASEFSFECLSDLTSALSFKIKKSTLANRDRREREDEMSAQKINDKRTFVELSDQFEEDLVRDLFKDLEHKK